MLAWIFEGESYAKALPKSMSLRSRISCFYVSYVSKMLSVLMSAWTIFRAESTRKVSAICAMRDLSSSLFVLRWV